MDESFGKDGKDGKKGKIEKDDRILAQSRDRFFLDRRTKEQKLYRQNIRQKNIMTKVLKGIGFKFFWGEVIRGRR